MSAWSAERDIDGAANRPLVRSARAAHMAAPRRDRRRTSAGRCARRLALPAEVSARYRRRCGLSCVLLVRAAGADAGVGRGGLRPEDHAQTRAEPPATLDVPQPPPRVVVPPQPEAPEVVEEALPPSPVRPRPARPAQRPEAKPDTARQDAAAANRSGCRAAARARDQACASCERCGSRRRAPADGPRVPESRACQLRRSVERHEGAVTTPRTASSPWPIRPSRKATCSSRPRSSTRPARLRP